MDKTGILGYFKRGLVLGLISLLLSYFGGMLFVSLLSLSPVLILVTILFVFPVLLTFYGWFVSWMFPKIN